MKRRGSGVLAHITSLPSDYGIGDLGPSAYQFADFLAETRQSFWQVLPLNPSESAHFYSPYFSNSAFAFNPLLISPDLMIQEGLLLREEVNPIPEFPSDKVEYSAVAEFKERLFKRAHERFKERPKDYEHAVFCSENAFWLNDFALFMALKSHFQGRAWIEWPQEARDRNPEALRSFVEQLSDTLDQIKFLQYLFFRQWMSLKSYCNERGIQIIGDIPIYVQYDSTDLWAQPQFFKLNHDKRPYVVAGVPPDYFSETGQLWGNPVYRWDVLKQQRYGWWLQRISHNLQLFDMVRIDHFRGLVAYWEVPAHEKTAMNGKWTEAPAEDFFNTIRKYPYAPIIAEDLGYITPDVREIMHRFEFPGMKLLLFAFGDDLPTNPYAPHNLIQNCVVYTGTHDNNTTRGWFENEATPEIKKRVFQYLGREITGEEAPWELIRLAMMSVANTAIIPLQDLLGLGGSARMNRPSTRDGNWLWRLQPHQLTAVLVDKLRNMTEIYGRA